MARERMQGGPKSHHRPAAAGGRHALRGVEPERDGGGWREPSAHVRGCLAITYAWSPALPGRRTGVYYIVCWGLTPLPSPPSPPPPRRALSDKVGNVIGGHVVGNLKVFTTCELVLLECAGLVFARELDPRTGFKELVVAEAV